MSALPGRRSRERPEVWRVLVMFPWNDPGGVFPYLLERGRLRVLGRLRDKSTRLATLSCVPGGCRCMCGHGRLRSGGRRLNRRCNGAVD